MAVRLPSRQRGAHQADQGIAGTLYTRGKGRDKANTSCSQPETGSQGHAEAKECRKQLWTAPEGQPWHQQQPSSEAAEQIGATETAAHTQAARSWR